MISDPLQALYILLGDERALLARGKGMIYAGTPPIHVASVHLVRGPVHPVHGDRVVGTATIGSRTCQATDKGPCIFHVFIT